MSDNAKFYVAVKAAIFDGDRLLMTQGADSMRWELPGGRIHPEEIGKPFKEVLLREVEEELGQAKIDVGGVATHYLRTTHQGEPVFLACMHCTWKNGDITLSADDASFRWVSKSESFALPLVTNFEPALQEIWHFHEKQ
jgi:8-oxo-dGTP pyrophosphatase MutT (NUDIX family)